MELFFLQREIDSKENEFVFNSCKKIKKEMK